MTTVFSVAIAASISAAVSTKVDEMLATFTATVANECKIDEKTLTAIWERVAPETADGIREQLAKIENAKATELARIEKQKEQATGPHCMYVFGDKAKRAGEQCGAHCKNPEPADDDSTYCTKHTKQVASKHTCEYKYGESSKKAGECCGSRVAKDADQFEYKGDDETLSEYNNAWMCKRHTAQVTKAIEREVNRCSHTYGDKSSKAGEQCTSAAKENGVCAKHAKGSNKKKAVDKARKDAKESDSEEKKKESDSEEVEEKKEDGKQKESDSEEVEEKKEDGKQKESDSEEVEEKKKEKKKKEKKEKKEKKGKKGKKSIDAEINFDVTDDHETEFKVVKLSNDDGSFYALVDLKSGIVATNLDNPVKKMSTDIDTLTAIGIWDNDEQSYIELTDEATAFAAAIGMKEEDEEDEEE